MSSHVWADAAQARLRDAEQKGARGRGGRSRAQAPGMLGLRHGLVTVHKAEDTPETLQAREAPEEGPQEGKSWAVPGPAERPGTRLRDQRRLCFGEEGQPGGQVPRQQGRRRKGRDGLQTEERSQPPLTAGCQALAAPRLLVLLDGQKRALWS